MWQLPDWTEDRIGQPGEGEEEEEEEALEVEEVGDSGYCGGGGAQDKVEGAVEDKQKKRGVEPTGREEEEEVVETGSDKKKAGTGIDWRTIDDLAEEQVVLVVAAAESKGCGGDIDQPQTMGAVAVVSCSGETAGMRPCRSRSVVDERRIKEGEMNFFSFFLIAGAKEFVCYLKLGILTLFSEVIETTVSVSLLTIFSCRKTNKGKISFNFENWVKYFYKS